MEENSLPRIVVRPHLRSIEQLFKDSFMLLKRHWAPLLIAQATVFFISILIVVLGILIFMMPLVAGIIKGMDGKEILTFFMTGYFWIGIAAIAIPIIFVGSWAVGAQIAAIGYKGEGMAPIGWSLREGFRFLIPITILAVITGLASLGGMLLFVFPAIILIVALSLVWYIKVIEDVPLWKALGTSWEITKDYRLAILGRLALLILCVWIVSAFFTIIGLIPFMGLVTAPANIFINLVITPFILSYVYLIYRDIRDVRQEIYPFKGRCALLLIICWAAAIAFASGIIVLILYLLQGYLT